MPRALTLAEAAQQLGVKPQRISQMLRSGDLSGPSVGSGRAPKGAGRVWESSIQQEISRRLTGGEHTQRLSASVDNIQAGSTAREAAALEAVLRMKVRLDDARDALREERRANRRLVSMLATVVAELEAAQAGSDRLDSIADGYSEALTQLLVPGGPRNAP
jgi:phage-related tail fiber protein